nr:vp39 [Darna trima granulovirus]
MSVVDYACTLNNYCVFQGVADIFYCETNGSACSSDAANSRADGTFICNYHLGKYFKMLKSSFTIPSGKENNKSFKMMVGQSLLPQSAESRVLIPLNYNTRLLNSSRNAMEKFIIYTIYNDKVASKKLCDDLMQQEFFEQPMWARYQFSLNTIMGMITPNLICEPYISAKEVRTFVDNSIFERFPPFLQNLIRRLVRPIQFTINNHVLKISTINTCTLTSEGLEDLALHNPNRPIRIDNLPLKPKFNIRTVLEFDGKATEEQRALSMYDEVILSRPLLNGVQINIDFET